MRACISSVLLLLSLVLAQDTVEPPTPEDTAAVTPSPELDRQIQENQASLAETQKKLAEVEARLAQLETSEKSSLAKMGSIDERIRLITTYIRQLQTQASARAQEIASVAAEMSRTRADIKARNKDLAARLAGIYKYGRTLPVEALLSTRTLPEVYRKMTYLRWIARADEKVAKELTELGKRQEQQRAQLAAAHAELERLQTEQAAQNASLQNAKRTESELLRKVRTERASRQELAKQLDESAQKLQSIIADLERRRRQVEPPTGTHFFEENKGRLPWPIRGTVIAGFGSQVHPRYKTKTTNLGIDIKPAAPGEAQAVAPGKVVYADQFMGYGNLVIVDHSGGFYSLYANLTEMLVSVGTQVSQGSAVGRVTDYLHFEIRRDGRPVSPGAWLSP